LQQSLEAASSRLAATSVATGPHTPRLKSAATMVARTMIAAC